MKNAQCINTVLNIHLLLCQQHNEGGKQKVCNKALTLIQA